MYGGCALEYPKMSKTEVT